jgi:acyl-CoA reductase-like NAD-dependent aldehyde dehydrogenase
MTSLDQLITERGLHIPEVITGHIAGKPLPVDPQATLLPIYFPGSGEQIASLQQDSDRVVADAIASARNSFAAGEWSAQPTASRQRVFRRAAQLIREHAEELALLECLCAGLPASHLAIRQVPRAAENLDFFADYIGVMAGESFEQLPGYQTVVTRQPAGVAALFAPWNAPLALSSMQIASSLAFGNTCVLKPSEFTPLSVLRMVSLLEEAGLPAGTINIVNGSGAVTGSALASSADVDRIAFTGGGTTARQVMSAAAQNLTPVHFELGGKSANIVFDDADFDRALDGSLVNIFSNSGQICIAGSRILVQRGIATRFIEAFVARTRSLTVGNPLDPNTEVGPMAFRAHWQRVLDHIARAKSEGAVLLCGGEARTDLGDGYYISPTVFQVEHNQLSLCQEEVFGPVISIQVFDDDEQAFSIANDSRFGLVGYCWTGSLARAQAFQQKVAAGTLWINTPLARDLRAPFGGFKESGIGRDGPRQAAEFFTEEKATITARGHTPIRKMGLSENAP